MTTEEREDEILSLRALARAVLLQRQPEATVVWTAPDGTELRDPFVRYASRVVILPQKLTTEQWKARYGHLAERRNSSEASAVSSPPCQVAAGPTGRPEAVASPPPRAAQSGVGVRRRSIYRTS